MSNLIDKLFIAHPASVGESYFQHLLAASRFSLKMFIGGVACLLHAVFPFMFSKTGSKIITDLYGRMVAHRQKQPVTPDG